MQRPRSCAARRHRGRMDRYADDRSAVSVRYVRHFLAALGLPCGHSRRPCAQPARLGQMTRHAPLITATVGEPLLLPDRTHAGRRLLRCHEDRQRRGSGSMNRTRTTCVLPAYRQPGYHRSTSATRITLAVAPPRCLTSHDIAAGERAVGIGVATLWLASCGRLRHRRHGRASALAAGAARLRRRCRGAQPDTRAVRRRSRALRPLFAVEPAFLQSTLRRSARPLRRRARSKRTNTPVARTKPCATKRQPDRLAGPAGCQAERSSAGCLTTSQRNDLSASPRPCSATDFSDVPAERRRAP